MWRPDRVIGYAWARHAQLIADRFRSVPLNWRRFAGQWLTRMLYINAVISITLVHVLLWPLAPVYELVRDRFNARMARQSEDRLAGSIKHATPGELRSIASLITLRLYCHPNHPTYTRLAALASSRQQQFEDSAHD